MSDLSQEEIQKIKDYTSRIIGENIRKQRETRGYTQTQLANLIGSDRQYLYKIETAKVGVSVAKLAVIAKALGIELQELVKIE